SDSGGIAGPPPDQHEEMVLETIPYQALGGTRVTFSREADRQRRGLISLDGDTQIAAITSSVWGTWVAESPTSTKLAYAGWTDQNNHDRSVDIFVRDWEAP